MAHSDFSLVGDLLHNALGEAEQTLFDLLADASGDDVHAAVEQVLIADGWPARPHIVGAISTRRTKVANAPNGHGAALAELVRALIEAARRRLDRLQGKPNGGYAPLFIGSVPVQPDAAFHHPAGITLGELIEKFRAEKEPAQPPKLRHDCAMLYEVLGDV